MKKIIIIFLLFPCIYLQAQDIHFSQFLKSSFLINPSLISFEENHYTAVLQRRSQWESVAEPFKTFCLSINRKEILPSQSFGLQFINDIAGDANFKTTGIALSYSKVFRPTNFHFISIGLGFGFFQRSLTYSNLIFYEEEPQRDINFWFPEINLGISDQYNFSKECKIINGLSFFHLNRPKQSITGDEKVRLKQKINFHSTLYYSFSKIFLLSPKVFTSIQDKDNEFIFGCDVEYSLKESKKVTLKSGLSYRLNDAIIYSFGSAINNFDFLISYDINTSSLSKASNNKGGFEFSIIYAWNINQKEQKIVPKNCPKYL